MVRLCLAARRNWNMRTAPTATVINPPATAANRMATPKGRLQCQPRNWNGVVVVFCAMKISNTIRMKNPRMSAVHIAAALVYPVLESGSSATGGTSGGGGTVGSVLIPPSLPFPAQKQTTRRRVHAESKHGAGPCTPLGSDE